MTRIVRPGSSQGPSWNNNNNDNDLKNVGETLGGLAILGVLALIGYFFGGSILAGIGWAFSQLSTGVSVLAQPSSITFTALGSGLARFPLLDQLVWAAIQGACLGTVAGLLQNLFTGRMRRRTAKEWILKLLLAIGVGIFMGLIGVYLGLLPNANWLDGQPPTFEGPISEVFFQLGLGGGAGDPPSGSCFVFFVFLLLVAFALYVIGVMFGLTLGSILGALLLGAAQGAVKGAVEGAASSAAGATLDEKPIQKASLKGANEGIREGFVQGMVMVIVGTTAVALLGQSSPWAWLPIGIFDFLFVIIALATVVVEDL
jgi:hypothetical protein